MSLFANKTLLITGGTGSFGNAVLNRFLETDIREIRIFSRDEKKQDDMRHEYQAKYPEASKKIKFYIGDVRDLSSVDARHAPTNNDITMARWFLDSGCPFVVVANKLDKVKKSQIEGNMAVIRQDLELPEECPVIPFSAEKGTGRDDLVKLILAAAGE